MGWLIAIGVGQLITLGYIAYRLEWLLHAEEAAAYTNLILGRLDRIQAEIHPKTDHTSDYV